MTGNYAKLYLFLSPSGLGFASFLFFFFQCRRDVSLELSHGCSVGSLAMANSIEQNRASSLSSDDGVATSGGTGGPHLANSNSLESTGGPQRSSQSSYPSSPRAERKGLRGQGGQNTPNTLTVQIPYGTPGVPTGSAPQTPTVELNRGISYPPLSPKSSLRRSKAVTQQHSLNRYKNHENATC